MDDHIVLVGSGPSLGRIDLAALARVPTIAFNRSFVGWPRWGFVPTLYACLDPASARVIAPELHRVLEEPGVERLFLAPSLAVEAADDPRVRTVASTTGTEFRPDLASITDYGNVGASSLQILAALGIRRVLLVGVDAHYRADAAPGRDHNHFDASYALTPPEGDLGRFVEGWPRALEGAAAAGLACRIASPGSRLNALPILGGQEKSLADNLAWLREGGRF